MIWLTAVLLLIGLTAVVRRDWGCLFTLAYVTVMYGSLGVLDPEAAAIVFLVMLLSPFAVIFSVLLGLGLKIAGKIVEWAERPSRRTHDDLRD